MAQDCHLRVAGNGPLGALVHFLRNGTVEVVLAAVFADVGGHIPDDHDRLPAFQGNSHRPRMGHAMLAEKTRHGFLLVLKSTFHSSKSGR
jgi:hypothetical protein